MQVVVQELLTNYTKMGSGRTVLLLHGWGDSSKSYTGLQKNLSKQFTVISLDLPGFGATQVPPMAWSLEEYAQFIHAFLQKLQEFNVYGLIGHSNGGAVAIYGLAHHIIKADKLILLGAAGIRDSQQLRRLSLQATAKAGKIATFWLPTKAKQKLRKKLYSAAGSEMLDLPHMEETFKQTVRHDVQGEAMQLKLPTLLIYGQDDTATPPAYGEVYASLVTNSELHVIPEAGHFVHHDQAPAVLRLIEEFLQ